jgi:hypothetical protein
VTAGRAPGALGVGAGQGKTGRELTAGPCVIEATAGGGAEAFVGSEWSAVAGESRGMLLRLKCKERMVRRGQMCSNQVLAVSHQSGRRAASLRHKMVREVASGSRNGQDRFGERREVAVSSSADERRGGRVMVKRPTVAFDRREGRYGGGAPAWRMTKWSSGGGGD